MLKCLNLQLYKNKTDPFFDTSLGATLIIVPVLAGLPDNHWDAGYHYMAFTEVYKYKRNYKHNQPIQIIYTI